MTVLAGAAAYPLLAGAQQKAMPVIGWLSNNSPCQVDAYLAAFRQGLGEAGYVEGQNVSIEYRWADNHYHRLPSLAAELVVREVDVIATSGGEPSAFAAKNATLMIPIVSVVGQTRLRLDWSPVSRAQAATSPGSPFSTRSLPPSGSNCSATWFPGLR